MKTDQNNLKTIDDRENRLPLVGVAQTDKATSVESYLGCGCYQVYHVILSQLITIAHSANMTMMAFGIIIPEWTCHDWTSETNNTVVHSVHNDSGKSIALDKCQRLAVDKCQNLTMVSEYRSVVYEWSLLCDDMKYVFLSLTLQMVGVISGCQIWGQLADWYGRKWILFTALWMQILVACLSIYSTSITVFTIFRVFIGFFAAGTIGANHVYFNEFVVSRHRLWLGAINSWGFAQMVLAVVAWLTRDWKATTVVCNFIAIPALLMICLMKESPFWLIQRGRTDAARRSINRVTTMNLRKSHRVAKNDATFTALADTNVNVNLTGKKYSLWHPFSRQPMASHTITLGVVFFSTAVISYGILFDTGSFAGNKFLNFFLFAALKSLASLLTIFADAFSKSIGRRMIYCFSNAILTVCCFTIFFLKIFGMAKTLLETVVSIIAIMATSPIWTSVVLSATELYPTPVRNIALGVVSAFSRIGGAAAPLILYAAKFWAPSTYLVYFALAGLSMALYIVYIPETKGISLPELMPQKNKRNINKNLLLNDGEEKKVALTDQV